MGMIRIFGLLSLTLLIGCDTVGYQQYHPPGYYSPAYYHSYPTYHRGHHATQHHCHREYHPHRYYCHRH